MTMLVIFYFIESGTQIKHHAKKISHCR